jgi:TolB-like protein/Flp pilus assembly protein TadD
MHRRARVAGGALLVAAAGYAGWLLFGPRGPDGPVAAGGVPGGRPSLAVLAFDNISDDPTQEYFSDGISEDLITDLAKISALQVMARNTTFAYKGQASDVTKVGRELGVDYVVEGSVRKADGRIRVNAQLIDVRTGAHVWADRYDGPTQDVFAVQDAVVARIVQALRVTLTPAEEQKLRVGGVDNLTAYDLVKRGWWHYHQFNRDDNERAREMFNRALEVVPEYAEALTGLGFTYYEEWAQLWTHDPTNLDLVRSLAQASLDLNPSDPGTHTLLSHAFLWTNQHDLAVAELRAALALAPDDPWLLRDLAEALLFAGETSEAASYAERAIELVPRPVAPFPFTLGFAYHALGRYEESVRVLEEALELNPNYMPVPLLLALSHLFLGNTAEARRYAAHAMDLNPGLSVDLLRERMPFRDSAVWAQRAELLRQIGVP